MTAKRLAIILFVLAAAAFTVAIAVFASLPVHQLTEAEFTRYAIEQAYGDYSYQSATPLVYVLVGTGITALLGLAAVGTHALFKDV